MNDEENMVEEHDAQTGEIIRRKATDEELTERAELAKQHQIGDIKE